MTSESDKQFLNACKKGVVYDVMLIGNKYIVSDEYFSYGLFFACTKKYTKIINFILGKTTKSVVVNYGLRGGCDSGDMNIVNLMIEKGANNWDEGLRDSCKGGHIEIVKLMIEKGAIDFNGGLNSVCVCCKPPNLEIAELMIQQGANDLETYLQYACDKGYMELAKILIKNGAVNFNEGLMRACSSNQPKMIKLMVKHGAVNFNEGLVYACVKNISDGVESVEMMIAYGATNMDECLTGIMKYWGKTPRNHTIREAVKVLINKGAKCGKFELFDNNNNLYYAYWRLSTKFTLSYYKNGTLCTETRYDM